VFLPYRQTFVNLRVLLLSAFRNIWNNVRPIRKMLNTLL